MTLLQGWGSFQVIFASVHSKPMSRDTASGLHELPGEHCVSKQQQQADGCGCALILLVLSKLGSGSTASQAQGLSCPAHSWLEVFRAASGCTAVSVQGVLAVSGP